MGHLARMQTLPLLFLFEAVSPEKAPSVTPSEEKVASATPTDEQEQM